VSWQKKQIPSIQAKFPSELCIYLRYGGKSLTLNQITEVMERVIRSVTRTVSSLGVALVILMMFDIVIDVVLRFLLNMPVLGTITFEAIGFMMVILTFLAIPYCEAQRAHISVDLLTSQLPKGMQAVIRRVTYFLSLFFLSVITWQSMVWAQNRAKSGVISVALGIPVYPFFYLVAFGWALFWVVVLVHFLESLVKGVKK
jgi:TRAP-type C4-dicarboxylate transport system permease small subunit